MSIELVLVKIYIGCKPTSSVKLIKGAVDSGRPFIIRRDIIPKGT